MRADLGLFLDKISCISAKRSGEIDVLHLDLHYLCTILVKRRAVGIDPRFASTKRLSVIEKYSIEEAYCFLHQKWRVYEYSNNPTQKDDIELAIADYVGGMNQALYAELAHGREHFLLDHSTFAADMAQAVDELEAMLFPTTK